MYLPPLFQLCLFWIVAIAPASVWTTPPLSSSAHAITYPAAMETSSIPEVDESLLLLSFKASITKDPLGSLQTWQNGSSPCSWQGITCTGNVVSSVNLTGLQLSGSFTPNSLSNLAHLVDLDLSSNLFTGPLPPSFCNPQTHNLTILNLSNNGFSGPIPPTLGNCTSLVSISLYFNSLTGKIPLELGFLSNLEYLALSFNQLNGSLPLPGVTNCTKLNTLALSLNAFSGALPPEIGKLTNLQNLWLDSNYFSGSIPPELGNLTKLALLQLDNNNLTGSMPPSLAQLTSLTELLSLSINDLTGLIPPELGRLSNLTIITLRGNRLNGTIPKEIGNMRKIQGLFLGDNELEGNIPTELANCTSLQQLRLNQNRLSGSIPDAFKSLRHLTQLYVHDNMLQGPIPAGLGSLPSLQDLTLGYNMFEGPIPVQLASLTTMVSNFSMPHNLLNGSIPPGLGAMIHVQTIDLSANNLTGNIPANIGDCVTMTQLNLSFNSLTGEIPQSFAQLGLLEILDLSKNSLSGGIPPYLANLKQLKYINLSDNDLTGAIPSSGVFAKMNASSFLNNPGLCGPPLPNPCPVAAIAPLNFSPKRGMHVGLKVLIAVSSFLFVCMVGLSIMAFLRWKKGAGARPNGFLNEASEYSQSCRQFTPKELEVATANFSDSRLIGIGGVSKVYRATNVTIRLTPTILQIDVAVKVLSMDHNPSFSTELKALGSLRHRNLVKLYGFCVYHNFHAFVLELLPNGSLQDRLYGGQDECLSAYERLSIALDVAHGLAHLHHGLSNPIVHRDVKPSNILFDQEMVARVTDFGIAKFLNKDEVFTKARGTLGYVAPEYGELTRVHTKGDVYSFGIVMLEMLTKKSPTNAIFGTVEAVNLPMWVRNVYPDRIADILDPQLLCDLDTLAAADKDEEALKSMVEVALLCTELRPDDRPDMQAVVQKLTAVASSLSLVVSQRKSSLNLHEEVALKGKV